MKKALSLVVGTAILGSTLCASAFADSGIHASGLAQVDSQALSSGNRATKVVGSTVVNEANDTVGTVDDLIITPVEKVPYAVLSVGGFLGVGSKYVVVPYSSLRVRDKKMLLAGATKDSLRSLPAFKYGS